MGGGIGSRLRIALISGTVRRGRNPSGVTGTVTIVSPAPLFFIDWLLDIRGEKRAGIFIAAAGSMSRLMGTPVSVVGLLSVASGVTNISSVSSEDGSHSARRGVQGGRSVATEFFLSFKDGD